MRKLTKIWLIIATSLILIGAGIFTVMLSESDWDLGGISTVDYKTSTYTSLEPFQDISIETRTADISFIFTEIDCAKVVCYEMEKAPHNVSFTDGELVIKQNDQRVWYDHISINFDSPKIKVYLPLEAYGKLNIDTTTSDISIPDNFKFESINIESTTGDIQISASVTGAITAKTTTGDITVENANIGSLDYTATTGKATISDVICYNDLRINVSTGKMNLSNVKCNNFNTNGTTGDISMHNVIADKLMFISRTTGDVKFNECDAGFIHIRIGTGDVTGSLLSGKIFTAESSTGKISVPDNTPGGTCVITTSTGDIKVSVA